MPPLVAHKEFPNTRWSPNSHVLMIDNTEYRGLRDLDVIKESLDKAHSKNVVEHVTFTATTFRILLDSVYKQGTWGDGYAAGYEDGLEDRE